MNNTIHPIPAEEVMAFLDGELPAEQAAAVSAHLEGCAACREVAGGFRHVGAQMAAWTVEPAPARLTNPVKALTNPWSAVKAWAWRAAVASAVALVVFAIATPNLLRSRSAANHASQHRTLSFAPSAVEASGPMIARTASLALTTKEFDNGRAAIERIVRAHQGYVAQLQTSGQQGAGRALTVNLRVPANHLDAMLAELKQLGHVEQETQGGEEVTQQYVDLVARLSNARAAEQRLLDVLRQRTAKMIDVLQVEKEVARVRETIEVMDAQRQIVEKRVALASVDVQVREEFKAQVNPGPPSAGRRLWNASVEGYRNLSETVISLAEFLLAYGPTLVLWTLLLWLPARYGWKRLRARAT